MAREYMCAYHSLLETAQRLNDTEFGRLMRAAIAYSASGELPQLGGRELLMWDMVKWQVDRDIEKFRAFTEKQTENGKKGGRPKKPTETQKTQAFSEKPKKAKTTTTTNIKKPTVSNPLTPFEQAVEDFKAHRKQIRKPMSDLTVEHFLAQLEKLAPGDEQKKIEIIHRSIANGWQGVFPLDSDKKKGGMGSKASYEQRKYCDEDFKDLFMDLDGEV